MASYKHRLTADLDRWIAGGLVAADQREAILASVPDARRMDAATALAWVGSVLLGVAVIAFIASNWEVIPRLGRFALILIVYGAAAGAAAVMAKRGREVVANGLLTFAALVFAAAIGLAGQIFDIAGDPRAALYMSGAAALGLAVAGLSSGPAMAALLFIALADFMDGGLFGGGAHKHVLPALIFVAPALAAASIWRRSAALAHASALGILLALLWLVGEYNGGSGVLALAFAFICAGLALVARRNLEGPGANGAIFYGWFVWGALAFLIGAGFDSDFERMKIVHRLAWLGVSGGLITLGRHDRSAVVTAAGVLGLLGAIAAILGDLGLGLMTSAGVFFVSALVALSVGFALRRRRTT